MPVLLDIAVALVVFAHHFGHVSHPGYLPADRIGEDDLIGNLFLAALGRLDMDRYLLVVIVKSTAHCRHSLCLQTAEQSLLADAVGLKPLAVHVK